ASYGSNGNWTVDSLLPDYDIRCLAVDPLQAEVIYAGTHSKGVLRSVDRGKTWQAAGLVELAVRSLAVSRSEPGTVYVGAKPPMLFVSRDGGATWTELSSFRKLQRWFWFSPAELPSLTPYVQSIALSPTDPNVIVAGIEAGAVVRSDDGGRT